MRENMMIGSGGGGKLGKSNLQQQGWSGMPDQMVGSFASKLTLVLGIGCICSCAYVVLLLVTGHPCWAYGSAAASYCGSGAAVSFVNSSSMLWNETSEGKSVRLVAEESKGTSLEKIVFGIGASADLWRNRSQFINLWWKQGQTRGFVWFDRDLGKDWKPTDPPYKVSEDTSHFQYTHKTGHKSAIRISRIVSESYRLGLADVDWFVMGDDDTFFFTENLVRVLSKYDPRQLWYIGSNSEDHIQNQLFSYNMAYGGGGFAISRALAKLLSEKQDACIHRYPWLFGSDDRMKACMSELGVPLTKEPGFHQFDVRGDVRGLLAAHPMAPIISLHHLEALYPLFPNYTRAGAIAHLLKAVDVSPQSIFQQSICYDEEKKWSFSVSWGFAIYVYKGFVAPNILEVPTLTFLSWHKRRESYAFPLNTRPRERDICEEASEYYLSQVKNPDEGPLIRTSYAKGDRLNKRRVCQQKLYPMSIVETIFVESEPVGDEFIQNPRRQCCRVMDIKKEFISIHVGACGDGETLVSDNFGADSLAAEEIAG